MSEARIGVEFAPSGVPEGMAQIKQATDKVTESVAKMDAATAKATQSSQRLAESTTTASGSAKKYAEATEEVTARTTMAAVKQQILGSEFRSVRDIANASAGTFHELAQVMQQRVQAAIDRVGRDLKAMNADFKLGRMTVDEYRASLRALEAESRQLQAIGGGLGGGTNGSAANLTNIGKTMESVAETAPKMGRAINQLRGGMFALAAQAAMVSGSFGTVLQGLLAFGISNPVIVGVGAGLALVATLYSHITEKAEAAEAATKKLLDSVLTLSSRQQLLLARMDLAPVIADRALKLAQAKQGSPVTDDAGGVHYVVDFKAVTEAQRAYDEVVQASEQTLKKFHAEQDRGNLQALRDLNRLVELGKASKGDVETRARMQADLRARLAQGGLSPGERGDIYDALGVKKTDKVGRDLLTEANGVIGATEKLIKARNVGIEQLKQLTDLEGKLTAAMKGAKAGSAQRTEFEAARGATRRTMFDLLTGGQPLPDVSSVLTDRNSSVLVKKNEQQLEDIRNQILYGTTDRQKIQEFLSANQSSGNNGFEGQVAKTNAAAKQWKDVWLSAAQNVRSSFETMFTSIFTRGEKVLTSLADLGRNLLNTLAQAGLRLGMNAIASGIGSGLDSLFMSGSMHSGGVVGVDSQAMRAVPAAAFHGAPRYHAGGVVGLRPDEVPAILQRGEVVLPRGSRGGSGGGLQVHQEINFSIAATDPQTFAALLETQRGTIASIVHKAVKDSAGFHRALMGRR